jgi:hypothetical protein
MPLCLSKYRELSILVDTQLQTENMKQDVHAVEALDRIVFFEKYLRRLAEGCG